MRSWLTLHLPDHYVGLRKSRLDDLDPSERPAAKGLHYRTRTGSKRNMLYTVKDINQAFDFAVGTVFAYGRHGRDWASSLIRLHRVSNLRHPTPTFTW